MICIANDVVKANQPNLLKEFGGTVELTDHWAQHLLLKTGWKERKGATGKVAPPALLLEEEKFPFQRDIAQAVHDHNIPKQLVFNATSLCHQGSTHSLLKALNTFRSKDRTINARSLQPSLSMLQENLCLCS